MSEEGKGWAKTLDSESAGHVERIKLLDQSLLKIVEDRQKERKLKTQGSWRSVTSANDSKFLQEISFKLHRDPEQLLATLTAYHPNYGKIGYINWNRSDHAYGQIEDIHVEESLRRRGIATKLFEIARKAEPRLYHDTVFSPEGKAWMESLPKETPAP